jgi:N-methylhydantoinase A/oxoprolinase/acetone carboxylase beta subunit
VHIFEGSPTVPVYRQNGEGGIRSLAGPTVIERYDSTILVPPGWEVSTEGAFTHLRAMDRP